jgi:hypothetical protein
LASIIEVMMAITALEARAVKRVAGLVGDEHRLHRHPGQADDAGQQLVHLLGVGVRQKERLDLLIFVLGPLLVGILHDDDGPVVEHLVEQLIGQHQLLQGLLERHALDVDRGLAIDEVAVEDDVDTGRLPDELQNLPDAGVVEVDRPERRGGRQDRLRAGALRFFAQPLDLRPRPGGLDPLANHALQLRGLRRDLPIRDVELRRAAILAQRIVQAAFGFGLARQIGVIDRRVEHRALVGDLVLRAIRIVLHRLPVVLDGGVPVARTRRPFAAHVGPARRARAHGDGDQEEDGEFQQSCSHVHFELN